MAFAIPIHFILHFCIFLTPGVARQNCKLGLDLGSDEWRNTDLRLHNISGQFYMFYNWFQNYAVAKHCCSVTYTDVFCAEIK
jgi:hypothetical protein